MIIEDQVEREQALNPRQSFIIQAPAGSGKTELLIQRFLVLLNTVTQPQEILAITFTKKAAQEMRSRILEALDQATHQPMPNSMHAQKTWKLARKALERDKKFNWQLLLNPNQLAIMTIDSLCAYLSKHMPMLSHFGANPEIASDPVALYREAIQQIIEHLEEHLAWSPAIKKLLCHLNNDINQLQDLLVDLLSKREQWLAFIHIEQDAQHSKAMLESQWKAIVEEKIIQLKKEIQPHLANELIMITHFAAKQLLHTHPEHVLVSFLKLNALPEHHTQSLHLWQGLVNLLFTKQLTLRKRPDANNGFPPLSSISKNDQALHQEYRQRFKDLIDQLEQNELLIKLWTDVSYLPNPHYNQDQWEILQALLCLLKVVAANLRLVFQQHGKIDFIENTNAAILALGVEESPTDLALTLDYQIKHILVDEFQDTSLTQYQLLEKLTFGFCENDDRTLFIVGDPMQSIYRFREAEVGLFMRMQQQGIGALKLIPLTLKVNFRAGIQLITWHNAHFSKIFPHIDDIATGAVKYAHSIAHDKIVQQHEAIGLYAIASHDDLATAQAIVNLIKKVQLDHPDKTIAILVRSRTHLKKIIPELKKSSCDFHAKEIEPLAEQQYILDLISLTSAMLHLADRLSWLALLRTPWLGFTLSDLWYIASAHPDKTIWEQLNNEEVVNQLSSHAQYRLQIFLPLMKKKLKERGRIPLCYWLKDTWQCLGGAASLQNISELENINAYFDLLENVSDELPYLSMDQLREKIKNLYAYSGDSSAKLHIMTIHSAKGLEFDTVILPHLEKKMPQDHPTLLKWMDQPLTQKDKSALLLAPMSAAHEEKNKLYEYIALKQKIKLDYETDRLLYVAATRAKSRLYLFFNIEHHDVKPLPGSFLEKIWPFICNHYELLPAPLEHTAQISSDPIRIPAHINLPKQASISPLSIHNKIPGFAIHHPKKKIIGIVLHRLLQYLASTSCEQWKTIHQAQKMLLIHTQLRMHGCFEQDLAEASTIINQALDNVLSDQRGQWILMPHQDSHAEWELTVNLDGKTSRLIIDRSFKDSDGTRWIIDYKSTTFTDIEMESFLKQEAKKYHEQMQRYATAMRMRGEEKIRMALYFPLISAWHEFT